MASQLTSLRAPRERFRALAAKRVSRAQSRYKAAASGERLERRQRVRREEATFQAAGGKKRCVFFQPPPRTSPPPSPPLPLPSPSPPSLSISPLSPANEDQQLRLVVGPLFAKKHLSPLFFFRGSFSREAALKEKERKRGTAFFRTKKLSSNKFTGEGRGGDFPPFHRRIQIDALFPGRRERERERKSLLYASLKPALAFFPIERRASLDANRKRPAQHRRLDQDY